MEVIYAILLPCNHQYSRNTELNDRVFDAMLEVACGEVMDERIAEWDALNTTEHEFSPEFEQSMKKLIHSHTWHLRAKSAKKALKRVAILIVAFMVAGFTFTMSVQALRVQFFNTIKEIAEEYIGFTFGDGEAEQPSDELKRSANLPEGFWEESIEETLNGPRIVYTDAAGSKIYLYQQKQDEGLDLRIDNEHTKTPYNIEMNGVTVQVYERKAEGYRFAGSGGVISNRRGGFCVGRFRR